MRITGLDHLALAVRDLGESEDFYTRILGGSVIHRHGDKPFEKAAGRTPQVWVKVGEVVFALNDSTPEVPKGHFVHWALKGRFEDIDHWLGTFRREKIKHYGPFGHGGLGLISIYFHDPTGYLLEIGMDAGSWERAKAEVKRRGGLFGNTQATYDPDEWEYAQRK